MAKFGINDILNAKTKAAGQQAQTDGYKEIYLSPYEVKAAQENTHQKLENIEELADSFLHVGQEQPTVLARVNGEYRIIDGHRRNAANILNLERGHKEYEKVLYRFMDMSEASKDVEGMHAASDTLKEWLYEWNKYHPDQPLYAIKADIHHYFQSIDHAVLKTEIRKVIKDAGVLALLDRIIDHNGNMPDGVGIPVGNLTSQLFANIYLDALDQFIKHELGVEAYIRYMDDFVILSPDKEQLRNWLARIEQFLREELKLEFNPKTTMLAAKNGIDFVGYKHRATHRKVRKDSIKRIKRTIKKCESGKITKEQLQKSIQSWTGHAGHADSYNLRKKIETLAEAAIEKAA